MPNDVYSISTPTLSNLITSYRIEFPRYQRCRAWDSKDKFMLFISIFKSYPIGSIVVKELVQGDKWWILDGRQRYETIKEMQNPETVYSWAKKFCDFKDSDDIKKVLKSQISEYLGYDIVEYGEPWIANLSKVVCTVGHIKASKNGSIVSSGFRDPFVYKTFRPKYIVKIGDHLVADSEKLLNWILGSGLTTIDPEELTAEVVLDKYDVKEEEKEQVLQEITSNINDIKKVIEIVKIIQTALNNSLLSIIILSKNCKPSDEMKIFDIVNTGGEPLSNAQIRSARKVWNYEVSEILDDDKIQIYREKLYKEQQLTLADNCVSWDYAATFVDRLNDYSDVFLFKDYRKSSYNSKISKDKMEIGFKLLSARYIGSVTKESIDLLPKDDFPWSYNCVKFSSDINSLSEFLIKHDPIFEHFYYYGFSMFKLGQNTAICFLILALQSWDSYGRPSSGQKFHSFIQDIRLMLDSFIFDYISDKWNGSGDSLLERKIREGPQAHAIKESDWNNLIDGLFDENKMSVGKAANNKVRVLVYYFTAIRNIEIHGTIDVDHIIPQSQFMDNTPEELKLFKHSLVNLALLPSKYNKKKADWVSRVRLPEKEKICTFEDLDIDHLDKIVSAAGIPELKEMRRHIVPDIKKKHSEYVTCSGYWVIDR